MAEVRREQIRLDRGATVTNNTRYFVIVATRLASRTYVMESSVSYVWKSRTLSTNLKIRDPAHALRIAVNTHCVAIICLAKPDRQLAVVLKQLRFAKQRFNSAAGPVAKVAFMLLPIATLLAMSSADQRRNRDDRARAKALLRKLQSNVCLALWFSVDCTKRL